MVDATRPKTWIRSDGTLRNVHPLAFPLSAVLISLASGLLVVRNPGLAVAVVAGLLVVGSLARERALVLYALPLSLLFPVSSFVYRGAGPNLTFERTTVLVASIAVAARWATGARPVATTPSPVPRYIKWPVAFFTVDAFAVAVADPSSAALHQAFSISIGAAAPAALVIAVAASRSDIDRLARMISTVGAVVALVAILESAVGRHLVAQAPGMIFYSTDRAGHLRAQSVFPHPIVLGLVLALVLPLTLALWMTHRRAIFIGCFGVQIIALLLTFSRGPWIGAAAGLAAMGAIGGRRAARHFVLLASLVLMVAASPLGGPVSDSARTLIHPQTSADVSTVSYRRQLLDASWSYMERHPAGSSLDPHRSPTLIRDVNGHAVDVAVSVDNAYLKYGLQIGFLGAGLMLLVLLSLVRAARRAALRDATDALPAALFGSLVAMTLISATVATFTWAQAGVLFSIIAGMAITYSRLGPSTPLDGANPEIHG